MRGRHPRGLQQPAASFAVRLLIRSTGAAWRFAAGACGLGLLFLFAPARAYAQAPATPSDSLRALERSFAQDSTRFDVLVQLGARYLAAHRLPESVRMLERARRLHGDDACVLSDLGAAYAGLGVPSRAIELYNQAGQLAPRDVSIRCRMADVLYQQHRVSEAVDQLRLAIRSGADAPCAYFTLGVAFADLGLFRDAVRMFQRVVELDPGSERARSASTAIRTLSRALSP